MITTFVGDVGSGDCGPAVAARLDGPTGLAVDSQGNVYIADSINGRVLKVDSSGFLTPFAGIDRPASA